MAQRAGYHRRALRKRLASFALDGGGLLAAVTFVFYVWLAPEHVVHGDNAEFSALGAVGGTAHPSGYPLYVLWLRAWSWLPAASPAHAAAIATVMVMALQVLVLHAACRAWGARPLAATLATGLFAASPIVLRVHSEAEVFALNGLVGALVVWLAARAAPLRGTRRVVALCLVAGLGLSNHLTCVLVAPIGILGVVRGVREATRPRPVTVALGVLALAAGLLPYAYLFAAPDTAVSWGTIDDLHALVRHVLREDYGGPGSFSPRGVEVAAGTSLLALARSLGRAYLWLPAGAGAVALGYLAVRGDRLAPARAEARVAWGLLAASVLLAGPLLATRFDIAPSHLGLYVVQRFHLLAMLLLAVPVAVAVDRIAARAGERVGDRGSWRLASSRPLHGVLTVVGFLAAAAPSLDMLARVHSPAIERGLENLLVTLPPDAIVIGGTDDFHYGLAYLQVARGLRPDVATLTMPQVGLAHARERFRRATGIVIENVTPGSGDKLSVRVAEQALATGRPVFIDPYQATIAASLPTHPYGLVFRVLPRGTVPPTIEEVFAINRELYGRYRFGYPTPGPGDQLAAQVHAHYARAWRMIAEGLAHAGRADDRAFALGLAEELAPR